MSPLPKLNGRTRYVLVIKNQALAKLQAYAARTHQPAEVVVEQLVERLPTTGTLPPVVKTLGLLLLACSAHALAVADVVSDVPGLNGWVTYDQDNFVIQPDDEYTGGGRIGAVLGTWTITSSYSVLTDRMGSETRCDEATLTLQHSWGALTLGGGILLSGDLHGDRVQDEMHSWDSTPHYDLAYADDTARPVVVASYEWHWEDYDNGRVGIDNHSSTVQWRTGAVWAWEQAQVRTGLFLATGRWTERYALYIEPYALLSIGHPLSTAADSFWPEPLTVGVSMGTVGGWFHVGMVIDLEHAYGRLGVVF